jgi:hypothetical protein
VNSRVNLARGTKLPATYDATATTARWFWGSSLLRCRFTVVSRHTILLSTPCITPCHSLATLDKLTPNSKFGGAPGSLPGPFSTSYYIFLHLSSQSFFIPMHLMIPDSLNVASGVGYLVHSKSRDGGFVSCRLSGGVIIYINLTACAAAYDHPA